MPISCLISFEQTRLFVLHATMMVDRISMKVKEPSHIDPNLIPHLYPNSTPHPDLLTEGQDVGVLEGRLRLRKSWSHHAQKLLHHLSRRTPDVTAAMQGFTESKRPSKRRTSGPLFHCEKRGIASTARNIDNQCISHRRRCWRHKVFPLHPPILSSPLVLY